MTVLDLQTFAASTLADDEGLGTALRALESCLTGPDTSLDLVVQDLCSVPHLFEFIISVLPSAKRLIHRILDAYPTDPALVEGSSAGILLRRLSSALFASPPDLFPTTTRNIRQSKVYVEDALPVLVLLCSANFSSYLSTDPTLTHSLEDPEHDDEGFSGFHVRNERQKKPKCKNRNAAPDIGVAAPLRKLGKEVPLNNLEAAEMAREISGDLKMNLKLYLELLLEPSLARQLKHAYVTKDEDMTVHPPLPKVTKVMEGPNPEPSAHPNVQPMEAALYFENADRFGEWQIIIGTYATKKLHELANDDRKKCIIVVKKIKQLSNGHFSEENQTRLNGSTGIPIFEAKMQQDLRLVYQVDVVPDHEGEVERQVIKIYDICTHAQLNHIWEAMGKHLTGKGEEYHRRCVYRTPPMHPGGAVYLPACFPPQCSKTDAKPTPFVLSDKDMEELHSLLVLEKYVTFSQAFLHSLVLNQDMQYVFELTPQERKIVECTTSCYVLGRSGTGKTTTMLFKMLGIQRAWEMQMPDMPKPRQIFVTKSSVLAEKVQEYFTQLLDSLTLAGYSLEDLKKMQARNMESGLVDRDDEDRVDIPRKYSELENSHFPLFVTFDKLATMIAADVLSGNDPEARRLAKFFINTDEVLTQDSFVTYEVFARTYWPHFAQKSRKDLEPWLVFSEFMGIIKGSEKSLSCPDGFLDEETYCNLPARSNPTFASHRRTVYGIFKAYCKLKKERRHHDVADRTHAIVKSLLGGIPLEGRKVDYLYIDEAQDNLLIDALLLRLICRNPDGLFWAGDTAQTISAGCSFRFDDLKAFLYRIERDQIARLIQDRSATNPMVFQLAVNYRSHGGIVNCAQTVIERVMRFWPNAIDRLQPESGIIDGPKPIFFRGWVQDAVQYEQSLFDASGSHIELGAGQCILVRNEEALQKLSKESGEIGVVMTLHDSKGLEFNDVFLYNFFEDSAIDVSRWRVLLNYLEGEVDGTNLATMHAPSFGRDESQFAGVCSELKMLYVGITRARKKLWIFDTSERSEPMRMIWTARGQVENRIGTDVPHVSSALEEWESFGHNLFMHKKYPQAMYCFSKAEKPRMVAICKAFRLREVARAKISVAPLKAQKDAFLDAGNAFLASGNDAPSGKDKLQYYRNAADCYVRAENDRKAASAYLDALEYEQAARRFRKAGLFEKTLEVLHNYSSKIPSSTSEELYTVCRLFYCNKHDTARPRLPLFPSFEEELEFLEQYDFDFARARLLEKHRRYVEAAELHLSENRLVDAARDFLMEKGSVDAIQRATRIVLDGLWRHCSFGMTMKDGTADQVVSGLLRLANELPADLLDPLDHHEISMFHAIAQGDLANLEKLSGAFLDKRNASALLALDHFFSHLSALESYTVQQMSLFLNIFQRYARLLHKVISNQDPLGMNGIKRLFGITKISDTDYSTEPDSFLHSPATGDRHGTMDVQPSIVSLSKREIVTTLRERLVARLCKRVTEENDMCRRAVAFSQCLTFIICGQCNRHGCPEAHVKFSDLDSKLYNLRIGIHLQQICILQLMHSVYPRLDRRGCVLYWLTHLYEAFKPQSHIQGSTANLDLSVVPGARESLGVMKDWVWDALHSIRADYKRSKFLTDVLKLTSLIFAFDESNALRCIKQAHFNSYRARVPQLKYPDPDGHYVLEDIVRLFDGTQQTCISAGLRLLKHVIKSSLFVDLSVFCDCLEEIAGKISISRRLSSVLPLDGLILPRGWLGSNKDFSSKKEIQIELVLDVLDCVGDLLTSLKTDNPSQIYSLSHTKLTPILCNVFISRICRALCLLHYNMRQSKVRDKIKSIFNAMQTAGTMHRLYRKYVQARDNEYLKMIVEYDANAKVVIKDLVQLLHKQRDLQRAPPLRLPRIHHIQFADPSEIPSLLASHLVAARSDLRPEASAFVPRAGDVSQTEEEKMFPEEPEVEPMEEVREGSQEPAPIPDEPVLSYEHEPTDEEILAAEKIKATYRTYRKHRDAQTRAIGRGLKAQRNAIFIACLKNVYAFDWGRTWYRTMYLWALPHLIICLDKAISAAHGFKVKTKGLLKRDYGRLEEYGKQMTTISTLLKRSHQLREMIEPNAVMHQAKDKNAMQQAALEIKDLIRCPAIMLAPEIREEFQMAYELIATERQPGSKPEKPALNTDDL